jgi:nucleoside-diphosphate-sugar epimerase
VTDPASRVLVTGGGGYVGAVLVPELLERGAEVRVLDLFIYGEEALAPVATHPRLELVRGDIRDQALVRRCVADREAVVHLACISNDPSFELDPELGRSVNFDAFEPLVRSSVEAGVRRFVYASSSSVYGVSSADDVDEQHPLVPLTDYSKYKAACEPLLLSRRSASFCPVVVRPATVCGYSPRMRFDLSVNILTNHAVNRGKISVFGGSQKRPNLHIRDMVACYLTLLDLASERVSGETFNFGHQNLSIAQIAEVVRRVAERELPDRAPISIETTASDDNRSYHVSSTKIRERLGLVPERSIEDAICDIINAFRAGKLPNPMDDDRYYNVRRMQRIPGGFS